MIKSFFAKIYARQISRKVNRWASDPWASQQRVLENLIRVGSKTVFGRAHDFESIRSHEDFKARVPVRDYEGIKEYILRIKNGEPDVLWQGKPIYFAKTSGTTSGAKYIPITRESMPYQIAAAKEALLMYIAETGNADFVDGKMIFLQGSPKIDAANAIRTGRLSGIVAHYVPKYLQKNRLPSWETNCMEDWEAKVDAIVRETVVEDMRLISGIPSWVQMYFEKLVRDQGKKVGEIFPNFSLFVYGGVNYEPYRMLMEELIGRKVDSVELFPASEGFFAFQDVQVKKTAGDMGMLLLLNSGIFYEFIEADRFFEEDPPRISIRDVKLGVNYALIISTNAGLWGYNIGDTVEFTCLRPYRIIVTGRIKHFISAFGEHVIGKEVEQAMQIALERTGAKIKEFTVAPQVNPEAGQLPYHEWFVEFESEPEDLSEMAAVIDREMQGQNSYYFDLIEGNILQPLIISRVIKNGFEKYMRSIGKLGGQNKIPRLSNDRKIADKLELLK